MKKFILSGSLLVLLTGCTATNVTPPVNNNQVTQTTTVSPNPEPANSCPAGQYSCACATGNYCLKMGAMCLNPSSACPAKMQSYENTEYNFGFDYPAKYDSIDANYGNLENKIVQVQLDSTAYPKTNFGDAAFTVSEATAKSLDECLAMNEPEGGTGFKTDTTINGITFYTTTGNGAGAGNFYESKNYRTLASSECFEIVETIHTSNIGNYDPGTVTEVDKESIWTELDNILSTFNFTS